ncbi:hypothetical protein ACTFIV_006917 [Dictyostelium citrinum]
MVSGMDRYFQIATCFRDEDLRSDRQPEFTQVDVEMSFAHPDDLMTLIEKILCDLFYRHQQIQFKTPFMKMSYQDALEFYGTDRPDLRFEMKFIRLDSLIQQSECTLLLNALNQQGCVKAFKVKAGSDISRKEIERYTTFVQQFGLKGLSWMKLSSEGISSPLAKFFSPQLLQTLIETAALETNDLLFIAAGAEKLCQPGGLITYEDLLQKKGKWSKTTPPHPEDAHLLDQDPLKIRALAYDIVINGSQQQRIFELLQLSSSEVDEKFGFFVNALQYGTSPSRKGSDLMMQAPAFVSLEQLKELSLEAKRMEITWT